MNPDIEQNIKIEVIRDGGSLAAIFKSDDGDKYWLFLQNIWDNIKFDRSDHNRYSDLTLVNRTEGDSRLISIEDGLDLLESVKIGLSGESQVELYECFRAILQEKQKLA